MKVGDTVEVINYPNHYSVKWRGKVVEIKKSPVPFNQDVKVDVGDGKILEFLESALRVLW